MKYYIYFLSLFSLIILTFSCEDDEVKLGEDVDGNDIYGTAINDCVTYSDSSTAEDVKCENCSPSKRLSSDSSECLDPITYVKNMQMMILVKYTEIVKCQTLQMG
jgi:hypothetical protein